MHHWSHPSGGRAGGDFGRGRLAADVRHLARAHGEWIAGAGHFGFSAAHRDIGGVVVGH